MRRSSRSGSSRRRPVAVATSSASASAERSSAASSCSRSTCSRCWATRRSRPASRFSRPRARRFRGRDRAGARHARRRQAGDGDWPRAQHLRVRLVHATAGQTAVTGRTCSSRSSRAASASRSCSSRSRSPRCRTWRTDRGRRVGPAQHVAADRRRPRRRDRATIATTHTKTLLEEGASRAAALGGFNWAFWVASIFVFVGLVVTAHGAAAERRAGGGGRGRRPRRLGITRTRGSSLPESTD